MIRRRGVDGMVTAELALGIGALGFVLAVAISGVSAALAQMQCVDAARSGARAAGRGETVSVVVATAKAVAPHGAAVEVVSQGKLVTVTVTVAAGLVAPLTAVTVAGSATAANEGLG